MFVHILSNSGRLEAQQTSTSQETRNQFCAHTLLQVFINIIQDIHTDISEVATNKLRMRFRKRAVNCVGESCNCVGESVTRSDAAIRSDEARTNEGLLPQALSLLEHQAAPGCWPHTPLAILCDFGHWLNISP
jgi:hypothetical protein